MFDIWQESAIILVFAFTAGYLVLAQIANWKLQQDVKYWRDKALGKGLDK